MLFRSRVALVTDGRMSGASGKVPAAIHVTPEAARGGPIARLRDGDVIRLDATAGTLTALVPEAEWAARAPVEEDLRSEEHTSELQSLMRISYAVFCLKKKKLHES